MAEEVGIVMKLYDQVSPSLNTMAGSVKAFDKNLDDLEASLQDFSKAQTALAGQLAGLSKELAHNNAQLEQAQQAYRKLKNETNKGALDAAIDDQVRLRRELEETNAAIEANARAYKNLYQQAAAATASVSRANNQMGNGGGGMSSFLGMVKDMGLDKMLLDSVIQAGQVHLESALGEENGNLAGGILSGALNGAMAGTTFGLPGIITGGVVGGVAGAITAGSENLKSKDEAFKDYYADVYDSQIQNVQTAQSAGSAAAAQQELDAVTFRRLLGEGVAESFVGDLRSLATDTPLEYGDLTTMSQELIPGFGGDTQTMLDLLTSIGNAASAEGIDASGMNAMAQALSRLQTSEKASLEDLLTFQTRNVDVVGLLAARLGTDTEGAYDQIAQGEVTGTQAVELIQQSLAEYDGVMDKLAETFEGRTSTLNDTMQEIYSAGGETYNKSRSEAMEEESAAYGGSLGEALKEAYSAIGAGQAALENQGEAYTRDALSAVLEGGELTQEWDESTAQQLDQLREEYQEAMEAYNAGDESAGLRVDDILAAAEGLAQQQFEAGELYQANQEAEMNSLEALRENTAAVTAAANAYQTAQARTFGLDSVQPDVEEDVENYATVRGGHAYGLSWVPRDGLYYLHQDERVQTAQQARSEDKGRVPLQITITGNSFGAGVTAEEMAQRLADAIERKLAAGVLS